MESSILNNIISRKKREFVRSNDLNKFNFDLKLIKINNKYTQMQVTNCFYFKDYPNSYLCSTSIDSIGVEFDYPAFTKTSILNDSHVFGFLKNLNFSCTIIIRPKKFSDLLQNIFRKHKIKVSNAPNFNSRYVVYSTHYQEAEQILDKLSSALEYTEGLYLEITPKQITLRTVEKINYESVQMLVETSKRLSKLLYEKTEPLDPPDTLVPRAQVI